MNKVLPKAFMKRGKLKNNYNKNPTVENNAIYKKKDSKTFWKSIRPLFPYKQK